MHINITMVIQYIYTTTLNNYCDVSENPSLLSTSVWSTTRIFLTPSKGTTSSPIRVFQEM